MKLPLLALLALVACTAAPRMGASDTLMGNDEYYAYGGYAIFSCDKGYPIYFVRDSRLRGTREQRSTQAHEDAHLATMRTLGCEAYHELRSTPEGRLHIEMIAFCAQAAQIARDDTMPYAEALYNAATQLVLYYNFDLSHREVYERLRKMCP